MKIFKLLKDNIFTTRNCELKIEDRRPTLEFHYSEYLYEHLAPICSENYIDTTLEQNILKYKSNLSYLVKQTKENGRVDKFVLIRNDDYFPYDWQWWISSKNTGIEYRGSILTYELRMALARSNINNNRCFNFDIPVSRQLIDDELSKFDKKLGYLYQPLKFRSTKHFTINTPLAYTLEYNQLETNRKFTIIDSIDEFLKSGYGYSLSYIDAYLDITHENLKISKDAIVLLSEENYKDIIKNPDLLEQLNQRRLIIYKGDEALAINMLLSEMGILPARPGNKYMIYDSEIRSILDNSIINLCKNNHIEYNISHGNLDGKGGHFSDYYDSLNDEILQFQNDFISYLVGIFPQYKDIISNAIFLNNDITKDVIHKIGVKPLLSAIDNYNQIAYNKWQEKFIKYRIDRSLVTPYIHYVFTITIDVIKKIYKDVYDYNTLANNDVYLQSLIKNFFHFDNIDEQLSVALQICDYLDIEIVLPQNINYSK